MDFKHTWSIYSSHWHDYWQYLTTDQLLNGIKTLGWRAGYDQLKSLNCQIYQKLTNLNRKTFLLILRIFQTLKHSTAELKKRSSLCTFNTHPTCCHGQSI